MFDRLLRRWQSLPQEPLDTETVGLGNIPLDYDHFVQKNIQMKVCSSFILDKQQRRPSPKRRMNWTRGKHGQNNQSNQEITDDRPLCHCGAPRHWHGFEDTIVDNDVEDWTESDIKTYPTNSFGKIRFKTTSTLNFPRPVNYIRASDDTDPNHIQEIMKNPNYWDMMGGSQPNMIVSIIGTCDGVSDSFKKEVLNYGLMKTIQATHGWIITDGTNSGLSLAVGNAVHETQTLHWRPGKGLRRTVKCIGIAPWGCIRNHRDLMCSQAPASLAFYDTKCNADLKSRILSIRVDTANVQSDEYQVQLNSDHSRFLLIDDGYRNRAECYRHLASFRAKLEQAISKKGGENIGVPVVRVLIQGSELTVEELVYGLQCGIPLVICESSGKVADLLVHALRHTENAPDELERNLTSRVGSVLGIGHETSLLVAANLRECCKYNNLISIYNQKVDKHDLDFFLLSVLLQSKHDFNMQLEIAVLCDRADIAATKIFSDSGHDWANDDLNKFMLQCLTDDKLDFVKLFIDVGIDLQSFLTVDRLRELYNESITEKSHLRRLLLGRTTTGKQIYLVDIFKAITNYTRQFSVTQYELDTGADKRDSEKTEEQFVHPVQELFLWAVFLNRKDAAIHFWERTEDPLVAAVVATLICRIVREDATQHNSELRDTLKAAEREYETLAIDLISQAYATNPELAILSLQRPDSRWSGMDVIALAAIAGDEAMVLELRIDLMSKVSAFFGYLSVPRSDRSEVEKRFQRFVNQRLLLSLLYFSGSTDYEVSLIWFYFLYAYVVLFGFRWHMTSPEKFLHVVILGYILEEIRIIFSYPGDSLFDKVFEWWSVGSLRLWNQLYAIPLVLSVVAFVLRMFNETFYIAKIIMAVNFTFFMMRIFKLYLADRYLGPKVVMIKRMAQDLGVFFVVVIIFFVSYSVTTQALMFPHRQYYPTVYWDLFLHGIWELFGELNDGTMTGTLPSCDVNATANEVECWTVGWPVPIFLAAYLLFGNILMVNMLIATFTTTYEKVQSKSSLIWKYQMYWVINDYASKPLLPSPLNIIVLALRCIRYVLRGFKHASVKSEDVLSVPEIEMLTIFERVCRSELIHNKKRRELETTEAVMGEINEKISIMQEQIQNLESGLKRKESKAQPLS